MSTKAPRPYVSSTLQRVALPTTEKPQRWDGAGHELDHSDQRVAEATQESSGKRTTEDATALLSIKESLVLLQSLQQTRQHHVQELFPVFTTSQGSRPQGQEKCREEENSPPKHDIKLIGRCGLEVGPVSFQDISLYECRFLEYQHPAQTSHPSPSKTMGRKEAEMNIRNQIVPSVTTRITELSEKLPWLQQLLRACQVQPGAKDQDLKKLGDVVDHIAAGIPLPPTPPDGSAPFIPSLPRKSSIIRPQTAGRCWRVDRKKAPLFLLSFKENPTTKFLIPVQLSLMEFCQLKTTAVPLQSRTIDRQIAPETMDLVITMFLPCRGWGRFEKTPDLTRSYRTVTTRRIKAHSYGESASQDKMLRPLPADPKSDFGPIGGISIPAGMLEPVEISLTGLTQNISTRVRALATEIENFDSQAHAAAPVSKRDGVRNTSAQTAANGSGSIDNGRLQSRLSGTSVASSSQGQRTISPTATTEAWATAVNRSGLEHISQGSRRFRQGDAQGFDEDRVSSTPPAASGLDRPLGDIPWKAQLFERLLKRVPKRAFLQCRRSPPPLSAQHDTANANNPSTPVLTDLTQKGRNGMTSRSGLNGPHGSIGSRKRKAPESETTIPETTITLDSLEQSILKRTATPTATAVTSQPARSPAKHPRPTTASD
ncbi:hypothetical protein NliqN6_4078 [Naganishia liquefaciens]|uniref:Uncharacterized protein n=1 Tax=Naganishia liquefaciens TaxID=104408 RepID=A0A8H3TUA6_9TREE|nr:hypothetical protein NliqN6_4078 [Naganishia liquefaciens]